MMRLTDTPEWRQLRQTIAELSLVSHGTTQSFDPLPPDSSDGQGGKRPSGGPQDDGRRRWEDGGPADDVVLRSADHFRRQAQWCRTVEDVRAVLDDAERALRNWRRAPTPDRPVWEDASAWKRWARDTGRSATDLAREFGVSRQAVAKRLPDVRDGRRKAA